MCSCTSPKASRILSFKASIVSGLLVFGVTAKTHWMVNWLQILNQSNLVWRYAFRFNVKLLRKTWNWCWWRFTHSFCHNSNILGCTHCHWLLTLWFIDEDASFFHFFSQDNEHTELTVLLFLQNLYAIFAHILQHYHDYQSNVAIFPRVVQAYTQPYSFGGRITLIICQIKHELCVTIHEISTSWKKTLDNGPQYISDWSSLFCVLLLSFWVRSSISRSRDYATSVSNL